MLYNITYNKQASLQLKGIAILFMIVFHLFAPNPTYYTSTNIFSFSGIDKLLGIFCNRTVPIYIFMTGYALAIHTPTWNDIAKKIKIIYGRIWLLSLIFIPILLIDKKIQWSYSSFFHTIILGDGYIRIWWYSSFYIMILILSKLYKTLIPQSIQNYTFLFLTALSIFSYYCIDDKITLPYYLNRFTKFTIYLIVGVFMYRFRLFERIKTNISITYILILLIFTFDSLIKNDFLYRTYRIITFPLLIASFVDICNNTKLEKICSLLGKHSTNIWLIHGFFFYYYSELIYFPRYFIFVLTIFIFFMLLCSHIFNLLYKNSIDKVMNLKATK